jgi:group I intron endonuclease
MYLIYAHTSPSGKKYIGQTCQRVDRRWRNGNGYRRNTYFWRAIQKYGWDSFKHEIVFQCETLEEANRLEEWLISIHHSNDPRYGYNISSGADGKGTVSESTKELLRQKHKGRFKGEANPCYGRKHTLEERKKMSETQKKLFAERGHGFRYGKKVSDEARRKMSESRKQSVLVREHMQRMNKAKAKTVLCVETDVLYASTHEVQRITGFRQGNIAKACRENGRAYGLNWRYV